jgi:WD40 repeat protein
LVARQFPYGTVVVWDVATGQETLRFQQADRGVMNAIAWSPDGGTILTLTSPTFGTEGELELRDAVTGESLGKLAQGCGGWEARWSPDGTRIVTYGFGAPTEVWDVASVELLVQNTVHDPWNAAWSPDGTRIVSADYLSQSGPVIVWDAQTGDTLLTLLPEDFHYGTGVVAWSPDGAHILTFSKDQLGRIWDADTGEQLASFAVPVDCYGAEWSPSGRRFLVSDQSGVKVWDAETLAEIMVYPTSSVTWGSWSPDGTSIATALWNGDLRVYPACESLEDLVAYAKACCVLRELTPEERAQYGLLEREADE